jgi:hypothetical protein
METRDSLIKGFYRAVASGSETQRARAGYQCLIRIGKTSGVHSEFENDYALQGMREVASEGTDYAATALAMYGIAAAGWDPSVNAAAVLAEMGTPAALAGLDEMAKKLRRQIWHADIERIRDRAFARYW